MEINKRELILAAFTLAVVRQGLSTSTFAATGVGSGTVAEFSATQRFLFDNLIYDNALPYLAYAKSVASKATGTEAVKIFDQEISSLSKLDNSKILAQLNETIAKQIAVDFYAGTNSGEFSLSKMVAQTVPLVGLSNVVAREVSKLSEIKLGAGYDLLASLKIVKDWNLVPIVPKQISERWWSENVKLISGSDDLGGLLAGAAIALRSGQVLLGNVQGEVGQVTSSIAKMSQALSGKTMDYRLLADGLAQSVETLGTSIHMNKQTVKNISTSVHVLGGVLAGAIAGSAFGPVGTAVGALSGLLGGVLGGGGGQDSSTRIYTQLSSQISELQQQMIEAFQQIGAAIAALQSQIESDFKMLSAQVAHFEQRVHADMVDIEKMITEETAAPLVAVRKSLRTAAALHEDEHRKDRLQIKNEAQATAIAFKKKLRSITDAMVVERGATPTGYGSTAFVGLSYEEYFTDFGSSLTKDNKPIESLLELAAAIEPEELSTAVGGQVSSIVARLRHPRYASEDIDRGELKARNGAALVQGMQRQIYDVLEGYNKSPEAKYDGGSLSALGSECPSPLAPQDLLDCLGSINEAISEITDGELLAGALETALPFFDERLKAHLLLTDQGSVPALLYTRRVVAQRVADSASRVFCNPMIAAVDVFRRAISSRLSLYVSSGPNHSIDRITSFVQADKIIHGLSRERMPMSDIASSPFDLTLPTVKKAIGVVRNDLQSLFSDFESAGAAKIVQKATYWAQQGIEHFSPWLPDVVSEASDEDEGHRLSDNLRTIRDGSILLGVIEASIKARLQTLGQTKRVLGGNKSQVDLPQFSPWFPGFQEYALVASYALARPLEKGGGTERPPETTRAESIMRSLLLPINSVNFPPKSPNPRARPYPTGIGCFWGWGAEAIRPGKETPSYLVAAVLRPECALVGGNDAIIIAAETLRTLEIVRRLNASRETVGASIRDAFPEGFKAVFRAKLAAG